MTTLSNKTFQRGTQIRGKWNGNLYHIERLLGEGANGKVFLIKRGMVYYALKLGFDGHDHQSEVNALRALAKTSTSFGSFLIDVDDVVIDGKEAPFCVMKYIEGISLADYLHKNGKEWAFVIGLQLLKKLHELHAHGFVYGDLKMENMILSGYGEVELIDFGGVTVKGNSIKQFTELYDRGYWNAGTRVAEESYDLFSFVILVIRMLDDDKNRFAFYHNILSHNRNIEHLQEIIKENPSCKSVAPFLIKALRNELTTSKEAYILWRKLILEKGTLPMPSIRGPWLKVCFTASILLCGTVIYFYWS